MKIVLEDASQLVYMMETLIETYEYELEDAANEDLYNYKKDLISIAKEIKKGILKNLNRIQVEITTKIKNGNYD